MAQARVGQYQVFFDNPKEFHILKREIFGSHTYYLELETKHPVIFDVGAHIGLTALYFKQLFPQAQIMAIEPHPHSFALLEQNIWLNQLESVVTKQCAVAAKSGELTLYQDSTPDKWYSTTSFQAGAWNHSQADQSAIVAKALTLNQLITKHVDLLKLDIEGLEFAVLTTSTKSLAHIDHLIIEFHPLTKTHTWQELAQFLQSQGFKVIASKHGQHLNPKHSVSGLVMLEAHKA